MFSGLQFYPSTCIFVYCILVKFPCLALFYNLYSDIWSLRNYLYLTMFFCHLSTTICMYVLGILKQNGIADILNTCYSLAESNKFQFSVSDFLSWPLILFHFLKPFMLAVQFMKMPHLHVLFLITSLHLVSLEGLILSSVGLAEATVHRVNRDLSTLDYTTRVPNPFEQVSYILCETK